MNLAILTRFSFFGKSGWQNENSTSPEALFDRSRLESRFLIFKYITLPSIKAQTDQNFRWYILSSTLMPDEYKKRLVAMVKSEVGDIAKITFEPPAIAGRYFRNYVWKEFAKDELIALSVLDDDDALAKNFVSLCKESAIKSVQKFDEDQTYIYLSYPTGITLDLASTNNEYFYPTRERWINLGLTSVSKASFSRNPLLTRHKVVNRHHPVATYYGRKLSYIRTIHNQNDSTPKVTNSEQALKNKLLSSLSTEFPYISIDKIKNLNEELYRI